MIRRFAARPLAEGGSSTGALTRGSAKSRPPFSSSPCHGCDAKAYATRRGRRAVFRPQPEGRAAPWPRPAKGRTSAGSNIRLRGCPHPGGPGPYDLRPALRGLTCGGARELSALSARLFQAACRTHGILRFPAARIPSYADVTFELVLSASAFAQLKTPPHGHADDPTLESGPGVYRAADDRAAGRARIPGPDREDRCGLRRSAPHGRGGAAAMS